MQKSFFFESTLYFLTASLIAAPIASHSSVFSFLEHTKEQDVASYTMNFRNISLLEYVRFVSKITGINFIYNEADLSFNVTILSEEMVSKKNIISALIQVLQINGLTVSEQSDSLLITKNADVAHLGYVVDSDQMAIPIKAPIVTRIFRLKNINLATASPIIRALASKAAIIDTLNDSKQLIITDTLTNIEKIADLLNTLDNPSSPLNILNYKIKNVSAEELSQTLQKIILPFQDQNPFITIPQDDKNLLLIISTPYLLDKATQALTTIDIPNDTLPVSKGAKDVYIYKPLSRTASDLLISLQDLASDLANDGPSTAPLVTMIDTAKAPSDTNTIVFVGPDAIWLKIQDILAKIDVPQEQSTFWIYKIQFADADAVQKALQETASNIENSQAPDTSHLVDAIDSMHYIQSTKSLVFNGTPQALASLQNLLPTIDKPNEEQTTSFWIYKIQSSDPDHIQEALEDTASNIESSKAPDPAHLVDAIDSMHYVQSTNSLVFNGTAQAIATLQNLLPTIDKVSSNAPSNVLIYKPKNTSEEVMQRSMDQIIGSFDPRDTGNASLVSCLKNAQWIPDSASFVFHGDPVTLEKVKVILQDIDSSEEGVSPSGTTFRLYKLQFASGSVVEEQLKTMAEKLPNDTPQAQAVIDSLENIRWIPENNSLLISGTPSTIDKVGKLVEQFDVSPGTTVGSKDTFFIYSPQAKSAEVIQSALIEYADTFIQAGLSDPSLISSIESAKIVPSSNQIIFTGNSETLAKIKDLLLTIDTSTQAESSIHQVGAASFLVYPLHNVTAQQFMDLIHSFELTLQKNGALDPELQKTIDSMQWIKDTNSIMFVGPPDALDKISSIAARIDVPGAVLSQEAVTYEVYNPKFESGDQIIDQLCEFTQNLMQAGVQDQALYDAINHLKWIEKSNTLIISGSPEVIQKVKELIVRFDAASEGADEKMRLASSGFLVYKLQYHSGDAIQQALKKMAPAFSANGPNPNPPLASAIESLQWIQVTNSLLISGEADTLEKVKALIADIDIPLRQVFIEVLVIETDALNTQNFGLQWGGNAQYLQRLGISTGNFTGPQALSGTNSSSNLINSFQPINASTPPVPNSIMGAPSSSNFLLPSFDLGVIGDIIMHKGQSFLSLGSLINALQQDSDSTIIMNPKIITQDSNNSTIFVGQNIPYIGSTVSNQGGTNFVQSSNLEYRDVGTNLSITPTLGNDDIITLDITYTMSAVIQQSNSSSGNNTPSGIETNQTNMTTRVIVPDKHFVVLSGMMHEERSFYKTGIPCIGGIPILGMAFSENDRNNTKSNVIIFIRPQIIHSFDEYKEVTENQEDLYREHADTKSLRENFDLGLDFVKTPENE